MNSPSVKKAMAKKQEEIKRRQLEAAQLLSNKPKKRLSSQVSGKIKQTPNKVYIKKTPKKLYDKNEKKDKRITKKSIKKVYQDINAQRYSYDDDDDDDENENENRRRTIVSENRKRKSNSNLRNRSFRESINEKNKKIENIRRKVGEIKRKSEKNNKFKNEKEDSDDEEKDYHSSSDSDSKHNSDNEEEAEKRSYHSSDDSENDEERDSRPKQKIKLSGEFVHTPIVRDSDIKLQSNNHISISENKTPLLSSFSIPQSDEISNLAGYNSSQNDNYYRSSNSGSDLFDHSSTSHHSVVHEYILPNDYRDVNEFQSPNIIINNRESISSIANPNISSNSMVNKMYNDIEDEKEKENLYNEYKNKDDNSEEEKVKENKEEEKRKKVKKIKIIKKSKKTKICSVLFKYNYIYI